MSAALAKQGRWTGVGDLQLDRLVDATEQCLDSAEDGIIDQLLPERAALGHRQVLQDDDRLLAHPRRERRASDAGGVLVQRHVCALRLRHPAARFVVGP